MPPRWLTAGIVLSWLTMTGWLVYREYRYLVIANQPPPFTIDLIDEAQNARTIRWHAYWLRGNQPMKRVGTLLTRVVYRSGDDTFEMHSEMRKLKERILFVQVNYMKSMYRVGRDGDLKEMEATIEGDLELLKRIPLAFDMHGVVEGDQFKVRLEFRTGNGGKQSLELEPVTLDSRPVVLNPLHPLNRIEGLRPGQEWRLPLVNPLADALKAAPAAVPAGPAFLDASVSDEVQMMTWHGGEVPCLVIDYESESSPAARTWIRHKDGLVLRQEAMFKGEHVILERE